MYALILSLNLSNTKLVQFRLPYRFYNFKSNDTSIAIKLKTSIFKTSTIDRWLQVFLNATF